MVIALEIPLVRVGRIVNKARDASGGYSWTEILPIDFTPYTQERDS